jgi:hypothetical protein
LCSVLLHSRTGCGVCGTPRNPDPDQRIMRVAVEIDHRATMITDVTLMQTVAPVITAVLAGPLFGEGREPGFERGRRLP